MPDQLVLDLAGGGSAVLTWPGGNGGLDIPSVPWPLDAGELEDLRWYLEDYLQSPFGVWEDRGPVVRERMNGWGDLVFGAVFGTGPARVVYEWARERDLELLVRSTRPEILALPWELMGHQGAPVALAKGGMSRSLSVSDWPRALEVRGGRLRVLMVISRPAGPADVRYQMVARPLLERLDSVRGDVDLTVLRPPTFEALGEALKQAADAGQPYHVVHFDGHGGISAAGQGVLAFEPSRGAKHLVSASEEVTASEVAAVLAAGRVPVVVLNACQSGAIGKDLGASVAAALLTVGCDAVVAMAYSLYATAAAEFMGEFYEALFAGESVGQAVTAGRRQLFTHDVRPSPKGDLPLADWLVPVHYLQREVRFFPDRVSRSGRAESMTHPRDRIADFAPGEAVEALDPLAATDLFIGRDGLFYQIEAAVQRQPVVVLSGPGGTGKTELAKGFARWWADTGGVDGLEQVYWHSFEPGVASFGLEGVINSVGRQLLGREFSSMEAPERLDKVKQHLKQHRCLLIWDNFESVREMPDLARATTPLDEDSRTALREFVHWVRDHSGSTVIITSRAQENWLGDSGIGRVTVGGLNPGEAADYAGHLLKSLSAAQQRRQQRPFGELLQWLDGHPLAMRLTLPRLATADAADILVELQGTSPLGAEETAGPGRLSSLQACMAYSFAHLGDQGRQLLPALSLLQGIADTSVLTAFSAVGGVPSRFAGISEQTWAAVLADADRVGLLTSLRHGMYQVHPALPGYLAALWHEDEADNYACAREAAANALVEAYADFGLYLAGRLVHGDPQAAAATLRFHAKALSAQLGYALDKKLWPQASHLVAALESYWITEGRDAEAAAWLNRVREAVQDNDGGLPSADSEAGRLWLRFTVTQTHTGTDWIRRDRGQDTEEDLASPQAESVSREQQDLLFHQFILQAVAALDQGQSHEAQQLLARAKAARPGYEARADLGTALICMVQGQIELQNGQLPEAVASFNQALALRNGYSEAAFVPAYRGLAKICQQIGRAADTRGWVGEATRWNVRAQAALAEVQDEPRTAAIHLELGILYQQAGSPQGAERFFLRALATAERLGDRVTVAGCYHHLGLAAYESGKYDEARDWYAHSLAAATEIDYRHGMAISYHEHGRLAQKRKQLDEAAGWYHKSLAIKESTADRPEMALTLAQLGLLSTEQHRPADALEFAVRSVALFDEFPHPATGTAPLDLVRLTRQLGPDALERSWRKVTSSLPPQKVLDFISEYQPRPGDPGQG